MMSLWSQHHLDAAILLVAEGLVELRPLFERDLVGDHEGRIDLTILNSLHQLRQIMLHRSLRHPEGEAAVDGRAHRDLVDEAAIDADDRDGAEIATAMDRLA